MARTKKQAFAAARAARVAAASATATPSATDANTAAAAAVTAPGDIPPDSSQIPIAAPPPVVRQSKPGRKGKSPVDSSLPAPPPSDPAPPERSASGIHTAPVTRRRSTRLHGVCSRGNIGRSLAPSPPMVATAVVSPPPLNPPTRLAAGGSTRSRHSSSASEGHSKQPSPVRATASTPSGPVASSPSPHPSGTDIRPLSHKFLSNDSVHMWDVLKNRLISCERNIDIETYELVLLKQRDVSFPGEVSGGPLTPLVLSAKARGRDDSRPSPPRSQDRHRDRSTPGSRSYLRRELQHVENQQHHLRIVMKDLKARHRFLKDRLAAADDTSDSSLSASE